MKTLILGANGQVGRALQALAPEGAMITAIDNDVLDLTDDEAIEPYIRNVAPELIINASGYTAVDKAESERDLSYAINATAPGAMAWAAKEIGARLLHISTDFVFEGTAHLPYAPNAHAHPLSVYGRSKLAGEVAVAQADGNALTVRTAWVYSAGGANFVETMLKLMATREGLSVVADQIGTPTHADSLARALWAFARTDDRGLLHYTDEGVASWYDFAVAIHDLGRTVGLLTRDVDIVPIPTSAYPTPAARPHYSVLDKGATWAAMGARADHWRRELAIMIEKKRKTLNA